MNKLNFTQLVKNVRTSIVKHGPEILTGLGIAGMITTTVLAVKATPKALARIEEEKEIVHRNLLAEAKEEGLDAVVTVENLKPKDVVRVTWKYYIPAVVTCAVSTACLIGASSVSAKRHAALATAYTLSEAAMKEYQEKVIETIGEKKEKSIRSAIAKDKLEQNPVSTKEIVITDAGSTLCYDAISGRYFKSDKMKIDRAVNELNRRMLNEGYISLNEFYYEVGLGYVPIGDDLGWRTDKGLIELDYDSHVASDGTPCLVIGFMVAPKRDYSSAF